MKYAAALAVALIVLVGRAAAQDLPILVKQLASKDEEQRRLAAKAIGELGPAAKPAVPALTKALTDSDLFVRRFSAQALGEIGPDAKSATAALKTALGDSRKEVGAAAAVSLGRVGPEGVKVLGDVLADTKADVEIRRKAVSGVGKAGADAKPLLPQLADLLISRDLRDDALAAIGELGPNAKDDKIITNLQNLTTGNGVPRELRQMVQATLRKVQGKK